MCNAKSVVFLGNCQSRSASLALRSRTPEGKVKFFRMADVSLSDVSMTNMARTLRCILSPEEYSDFLTNGLFFLNPSLEDVQEHAPSTLVVNVFDIAPANVLSAAQGRSSFWCSDELRNMHAGFDKFPRKYTVIGNEAQWYAALFKRYMTRLLTEADVPVLLLDKVRKLPLFGTPMPGYAYPNYWDNVRDTTWSSIKSFRRAHPVGHLDLTRIVAGMYQKGYSLDELFLGMCWFADIHRDIEHLHPHAWQRVAECVDEFSQIGSVTYHEYEKITDAFLVPQPLPALSAERVHCLLHSSNKYEFRKGLIQGFVSLHTDVRAFLDMLTQALETQTHDVICLNFIEKVFAACNYRNSLLHPVCNALCALYEKKQFPSEAAKKHSFDALLTLLRRVQR